MMEDRLMERALSLGESIPSGGQGGGTITTPGPGGDLPSVGQEGASKDQGGGASEAPSPTPEASQEKNAQGEDALDNPGEEALGTPSPQEEQSALTQAQTLAQAAEKTAAAGKLMLGTGSVLFAAGLAFAALAARRMSRARKLARSGKGVSPGQPSRAGTSRKLTGVSIGNAHHIGRRENQEDSFGVSELSNGALLRSHGVLAVVADGMGGLNNGEVISSAVTSAVLREFPAMAEGWLPSQRLAYLAQKANEAANGVTGGRPAQSGSTLLMANVLSGALSFLSVGDSRICLMREGGLIQLTREHVYAVDLDRDGAQGKISFESASSDRQRHALTSYIGMGTLEHIDFNLHPIRLIPGDWVILMSDGVFNALSDEEIAACLSGNVHASAQRLEQAVLAKGDPYQDNFTAVILQLV